MVNNGLSISTQCHLGCHMLPCTTKAQSYLKPVVVHVSKTWKTVGAHIFVDMTRFSLPLPLNKADVPRNHLQWAYPVLTQQQADNTAAHATTKSNIDKVRMPPMAGWECLSALLSEVSNMHQTQSCVQSEVQSLVPACTNN